MEKAQEIKKILERRVQNIYPNEEAVIKRLSGPESLSFYFGIDPTGPQIHIGHTIPLLLVKQLVKLGHNVVILIGGFTARIGDPTGKESARTQLTKKDIDKNKKTYKEQIEKILGDAQVELRDNSEWLDGLNLEDIIKLAGKITVQQMISRDMFQERIKNEKPVYMHEFLYPLLQGYDSVALETDGEIGGNDQVFNMLVGRDLEKDMLGKDKIVLATYLLADEASGKKMSKTEGEIIAIDDSPAEIRRKVLALDDRIIKKVFRLCTEKENDWIEEREKSINGGENPRQWKEELADELISMYHGEGKSGKEAAVAKGDGVMLDQFLVASGAADSVSAGHRLIDQEAVSINGEKCKDWKMILKKGDKIKIGKGRFLEIE